MKVKFICSAMILLLCPLMAEATWHQRSGYPSTYWFYTGYTTPYTRVLQNGYYSNGYYYQPYYLYYQVANYTPPVVVTPTTPEDALLQMVKETARIKQLEVVKDAFAASGLQPRQLSVGLQTYVGGAYPYAQYGQTYQSNYYPGVNVAQGTTAYGANIVSQYSQQTAMLQQQGQANVSKAGTEVMGVIQGEQQLQAIREDRDRKVAIINAALQTPSQTTTQSSYANVPVQPQVLPAPKPPVIIETPKPMPDATGQTPPPIDRTALNVWSKSAQRCMSCHSGTAPKGGFDVTQYPSMSVAQKTEVVKLLLLPPNDPKHMPKAAPGAAQAESVPFGEIPSWTNPDLGKTS